MKKDKGDLSKKGNRVFIEAIETPGNPVKPLTAAEKDAQVAKFLDAADKGAFGKPSTPKAK